jgi:predicted amidohydrolase/ribosomal protein S18 acetylase RimI-like enzyme
MSDLDLSEFDSEFVLRKLTLDDYEQLIALELKCFPGMEVWSREQIASQVELFPEGQTVIEYEGRIIASSSSLVIDFDEYDDAHSWQTIADAGFIRNHDPAGDTLYGIEIMVDPEFRGMKLARRLYDARKALAVENNYKRIMIGGRIPGYSQYSDTLSAREYLDRVTSSALYDPVLTTQISNGFLLKRLIKSYLEDEDSEGYATLLEWPNIDWTPHGGRRTAPSRRVRMCCVQYQMRRIADFEEFATQCEYFVDVASGYKADFCIFPEIFTLQLLSFLEVEAPGLAVRRLAEFTPQYVELFSRLSMKYDINVLAGSHFTLEDDDLYNVAYLFHRNGGIDTQKKIHITRAEREWWGIKGGSEVGVFDTDKGKVAIHVCYDVEFPELSRIAVERGAEMLLVPFCTDERHGYLRVRYCAQARCIENQVYVAIAGTVGNLPQVENMDIQYAQSAILTPSDFAFSRDAIGAESTPNVETVVIHDIDLELLRRTRHRGTVTNWKDRRLDVYRVDYRTPKS